MVTSNILLVFVLLFLKVSGFTTIDDWNRLQSTLYNNYTTFARPVYNQSKTMDVGVGFTVVKIGQMDTAGAEIYIRGTLLLQWEDEFLKWDPSQFGNIQFLHPSLSQIWYPSFVLGNSANEVKDLLEGTNRVVLYHNGTICLDVLGYFASLCSFDMTYFPFDQQRCSLHFVVLKYFTSEIDVIEGNLVLRQNFKDNWNVVGSMITRDTVSFRSYEHQFYRVHIMVNIERQPVFFTLCLIIPISAVSFLSMIVFLVPIDSGERLSYSLSTLLALAVFMSFITQQIPASSKQVPQLMIYLAVMLLFNALSVVANVLVLFCNHKKTAFWPCAGKNRTQEKQDLVKLAQRMNRIFAWTFTVGVTVTIVVGFMNLVVKVF